MRILGFFAILISATLVGCLNGNVNSWGSNSGFGNVNLEVPIEMVDDGLQSNAAAITFNKTSTLLDTNDYDGFVSYSFEIIASNSHVANPYQVFIVDSASTTLGTITIPANTNFPTRYRISFSPNAGSDTYRVKTGSTTASQEVKVFGARILVNQVGATKTKIYIPLLGSDYNTVNSNETLFAADSTGSGAYVAANSQYNSFWNKNSAKYSNISSWGFEAVIRTGGTMAYASIYNHTLTSTVLASEVSTSSAIPAVLSSSFPDSAANFNNFDNFGVAIKAVGGTTYLYRAAVWVKLTNMSYGEIYYRMLRKVTGVSSVMDSGRVVYDSTLFSNPSVYFESTITANASNVYLWDGATADSGLGGAQIVGSALSSGTYPSTVRSGQLSLTNGNRYLIQPSAGGLNTHNSCLVVKFNR